MISSKKPFKCSQGRDIYYEYHDGEGTPLVFLNGLDDSMEVWKKTVQNMKTARPKLFVDLIGQGESLKRELDTPEIYNYKLSAEEQGHSLLELFDFLHINRRTLVGNSYGGGIALWLTANTPESTEKLVLINPFILRLDLSFPLARLYAFQYNILRDLTPKPFQSPFHILENSYEKFIHHYMHFRFKKRIHNEKLREVSVALSQGMMEFNSFQILKNIPDSSVSLIFSELDTLVPRSLYYEFWLRLPATKKRNCFQLAHGDHLILEQAPTFVSKMLYEILEQEIDPNPSIKKCWSTEEISGPFANVFSR